MRVPQRLKELHPNTTGFHYHMAIEISGPKRWNLVKRKLQESHGIVVNFSTSHDQYYYVFRYVIKEDQECKPPFLRGYGLFSNKKVC